MRLLAFALALATLLGAQAASANPFQDGWALDSQLSMLTVTHVKNDSVVESSGFNALRGGIEPDGSATLRVLLDSIDTGLDLRNVRMRFLLFETFQTPEAVVRLNLNARSFASLPINRMETLTLPFTLDLHGVSQSSQAWVHVMQISDTEVVVSTAKPISVSPTDFNLLAGIRKLEQEARVSIVPAATVTFTLFFRRRPPTTETLVLASAAPAVPKPANVAMEPQMFRDEECEGRFETLSKVGGITFQTGSATLLPASAPVLEAVTDIINRCEDLRLKVAGHTDSDGAARLNLALSERRAAAVKAYLVAIGVEPSRIETVGFGEAEPLVPNTSAENKARNRRIEFFGLS